jgi:hypothetical protein
MLAPRGMDPATHHLHLEPHDYHTPPISRTIQYKKVRDRHNIGDKEVVCCIGTRRWQRCQKVFHETCPHPRTMFLVYVRWNAITHTFEFSVSLIFQIFSFSPCILQVLPISFSFIKKKYVTSPLTFLRMYFLLLVYCSTQNFREWRYTVMNLTVCRQGWQFVGHVVELKTVRILHVYAV